MAEARVEVEQAEARGKVWVAEPRARAAVAAWPVAAVSVQAASVSAHPAALRSRTNRVYLVSR